MKRKDNDFFWPSFTDLMTSLFFIMLILYVLTFVKLKVQQRIAEEQQQATQAQMEKIKHIEEAIQALPASYFTYQQKYRRFSLNKQIQFARAKFDIPPDYYDYLKNVGNSLIGLVRALKAQYPKDTISYLIVIEGMSSNDLYSLNNDLSFHRALALSTFWKDHGIIFDTSYCDLQIAGSGIGGLGRDAEEEKNQRFLIQIIPKIGM